MADNIIEGLSSLVAVINLAKHVFTDIPYLYSESPSRDWKPIDGKYLEVFDLHAHSEHVLQILKCTDYFHSPLNLPPQDDDSIRVYMIHGLMRDANFQKHIEQVTSLNMQDFCTLPAVQPLHRLHRRCRDDDVPPWQEGIYTFGTGEGSQGLFQSLIRCHVMLRCTWWENRMICFMLCEAEAPSYLGLSTSGPVSTGEHVQREILRLSNTMKECSVPIPSYRGSGPSRLMQQRALMLRVCHAVSVGHSEFLSTTETLYRRSMRRLNDPAKTKFVTALIHAISQDSYFWEQIEKDIFLFINAFGCFRDSLQLMGDVHNSTEYREFDLELQGLCTALTKQTSSISNGLENRLKFLEIGRTVHDSGRVQLLSVLAIIFLPLSLASSILSMQTRFVDLHYLLYDFFGVVFLLGTLTLVLLGVLLFVRWSRRKIYKWLDSSFRQLPYLESRLSWRYVNQASTVPTLLFFGPWSLIVASFLVGMLNDVGLGLKILGYGLSGMIVLFCLYASLMRLFYGMLCSLQKDLDTSARTIRPSQGR